MREIKFKAWDKYNKRWLNLWIIKFATDGSIMAVGDLEGEQYGLHQVDLARFTGLKDKNGREIYEGDIVILSNVLADGDKKICKAVMDGWQSIFESVENGFYCPMGNTAQNYREIVGNIYQTPDLLTPAKV